MSELGISTTGCTIYTDKLTILQVYDDGQVYIFGKNIRRIVDKKVSSNKTKIIRTPVKTNIVLEKGVTVKKFSVSDLRAVIWLSNGNIYISGNTLCPSDNLDSNYVTNDGIQDDRDQRIQDDRDQRIQDDRDDVDIRDIRDINNRGIAHHLVAEVDENGNEIFDEISGNINEIWEIPDLDDYTNNSGDVFDDDSDDNIFDDDSTDSTDNSDNSDNSDQDDNIFEDPTIDDDNIDSPDEKKISNYEYITGFMDYRREKYNIVTVFKLFQQNISSTMIQGSLIVFEKKNKIYFYEEDCHHDKIFNRSTGLGFLTNKHISNGFTYYEMILPFTSDTKPIFKNNFVYIQCKPYHHFLIPFKGIDFGNGTHNADESTECLMWIYTKLPNSTNENFTHDKFIVDTSNCTIFYDDKPDLYSYNLKKNRFVKLVDQSYDYYYIHRDDQLSLVGGEIDINAIKGNDLYTRGANELEKIICDLPILNGLKIITSNVDDDFDDEDNIIRAILVVDSENLSMITETKHNNVILIIVNARLVKKYVIDYQYIIIQDLADDISIYIDITSDIDYGLSSINTIKFDSVFGTSKMNLYKLNIDTKIVKTALSDKYLFIETQSDLFYCNTDSSNEENIFKLQQISLSKDNDPININLIDRSDTQKYIETDTSVSLDGSDITIEKMIHVMESNRNNIVYYNFYSGKKQIASGDGVMRILFDTAIIDFEKKYINPGKFIRTFNFDNLSRLSTVEQEYLGAFLRYVISRNKINLKVKLPISFLLSLKKDNRIKNRSDYEYFIRENDENMYKILTDCLDGKINFDSLESDFKSIDDWIDHLLMINLSDSEKKIVNNLTKGFLMFNSIKNLKEMNYPTLDYYLSGKMTIDIKKLCENISYDCDDERTGEKTDRINKYKNFFNGVLEKMSDEKIKILLKNWTGHSLFDDDKLYIVFDTGNYTYNFMTCYRTLYINYKYINGLFSEEDIPTLAAFMDSLFTEFNNIKD